MGCLAPWELTRMLSIAMFVGNLPSKDSGGFTMVKCLLDSNVYCGLS